jgi:very-short-patch-repair endonuclease
VDDKIKYLVKSLSRTKRKDYENYVINAIYNRVNNNELKPISQQYVKTGNSYRLLDLFFPQLNVAIEVDEPHHEKTVYNDNERMNQIISALEFTGNIEFHRVKITSFNKTEEKINEIVDIIKNKIKNKNLKWKSYDDELLEIKALGSFHANSSYSFKTIKDISKIMDIKYIPRKGTLKINDNLSLWCPTLSLKDENGYTEKSGWINLLADEGEKIIEVNHKDDFNVRKNIYVQNNHFQKRVVFAKYSNSLGFKYYKFIGVYNIDSYCEKQKSIIYKRVAKEYKI